MIKDNEDHVGWLVRTKSNCFMLFDSPDQMESTFEYRAWGEQDVDQECPCLYNWNRGQCIIRLPHCTMTLCDLEDTGTERISRSIIVKAEENDIGV